MIKAVSLDLLSGVYRSILTKCCFLRCKTETGENVFNKTDSSVEIKLK